MVTCLNGVDTRGAGVTSTLKLGIPGLWLMVLHANIATRQQAVWGRSFLTDVVRLIKQGVSMAVTDDNDNLQLTNLISLLGLSEVKLIHGNEGEIERRNSLTEENYASFLHPFP